MDGYFDSRDEDGGDYWEFFPLRGMLRRHHVITEVGAIWTFSSVRGGMGGSRCTERSFASTPENYHFEDG